VDGRFWSPSETGFPNPADAANIAYATDFARLASASDDQAII
jgi:hypothetical protein